MRAEHPRLGVHQAHARGGGADRARSLGDEDVEHLAHGRRGGELCRQPRELGGLARGLVRRPGPGRACTRTARRACAGCRASGRRSRPRGPRRSRAFPRPGRGDPRGAGRRWPPARPARPRRRARRARASRQSSRVRSRTGSPVRTTSVTGRRWSNGTSAEGMTIPGCAPTDRPSRSTFRSRSIRPTLAALASSTAGSCAWITRSTSSTVPAAASAWATSAVRPITRADRRVDVVVGPRPAEEEHEPGHQQDGERGDRRAPGRDRRRDRPAPPRSTVVRRPRPRGGHPRTAGPRWRRGPRRRR